MFRSVSVLTDLVSVDASSGLSPGLLARLILELGQRNLLTQHSDKALQHTGHAHLMQRHTIHGHNSDISKPITLATNSLELSGLIK